MSNIFIAALVLMVVGIVAAGIENKTTHEIAISTVVLGQLVALFCLFAGATA